MEFINFNNNSHSSLSVEVQDVMKTAVIDYANVRSDGFGTDYRRQAAIEETRIVVANKLQVNLEEVFFNHGCKSSEVELINWLLQLFDIEFVITSRFERAEKLEHLKILEKLGKIKLHFVETSEYGEIQINDLKEIFKIHPNKTIVSLSHGNFFTGILLSIKAILQICKENNCYFHLNSALTIGRYHVEFKQRKPDFVTFDSSLLNGPANVGCTIISQLLVADNKRYNYLRKIAEISQNKDIALILGFRAAFLSALENIDQRQETISALKDEFIKKLNIETDIDTIDNLLTKKGLYNHIAFWAKQSDFGKYIFEKLDLNGICVSNINFPIDNDLNKTKTFINIGLSHNHGPEEIDYFVEIMKKLRK